MTKEELKQAAETLFASTAHQVLWANPKGEFFTSENLGDMSLKKDEKLIKFERTEEVAAEEKQEQKEYDHNAKDTIALIKATTSIEGLEVYASDERKSVISEFEKQHAKLVAEIEVISSQENTNGNEETDTKE